jgi:hypothetical protein
MIAGAAAVAAGLAVCVAAPGCRNTSTPSPSARAAIPVLYSTDLFHPPGDPDDHYDLAALFALPELEVLGIVLNDGALQHTRPGHVPAGQMFHITGRRVPLAVGLSRPLASDDDLGDGQPAAHQAGVELILRTLRTAREPVVAIAAGNLRDWAAACNREPDLFRARLRAFYVNAGNGGGGLQWEYNAWADPAAFRRILLSGVPIVWCPCVGASARYTRFVADETELWTDCAPIVRRFFDYALTGAMDEPIGALAVAGTPAKPGARPLFCTPSFLHAAGRRVYQRGPGDFVALQPERARAAGLDGREVEPFRFVPLTVAVGTGTDTEGKRLATLEEQAAAGTALLAFVQAEGVDYAAVMTACLRHLLAELTSTGPAPTTPARRPDRHRGGYRLLPPETRRTRS